MAARECNPRCRSDSEPHFREQLLRVHPVLLEDVRVQLVIDLLRQLGFELLRLLRVTLLLQELDHLLLGDLHQASFRFLSATAPPAAAAASSASLRPRRFGSGFARSERPARFADVAASRTL